MPGQAPPTKILDSTQAVELVEDEETSLLNGNYTQFAEFLAYIRSAKITPQGEVHITISVPYEHKYDAMPMTDMRGVMFVMQVHRPMSDREREYREQQSKEIIGGFVPRERVDIPKMEDDPLELADGWEAPIIERGMGDRVKRR